MVLVSFSIDDLWCDLWSGQKRQTMRAVMYEGKENKKWQKILEDFTTSKKKIWLHLYWKARSKNRKYLFTTILSEITIRTLGSLNEMDFVWDGFKATQSRSAKDQAYSFFSKTYKSVLNPMRTYDQIDEFKVFLIKWEAPKCRECLHNSFCNTYAKDHEMNEFYFKWGNDYFCPGFEENSRKSRFPYPRFIDFKKIPDRRIAIHRSIFATQNCEKCSHLCTREPAIGEIFDENTNAWCALDEDRYDYPDPDQLQESFLWFYLDCLIHDTNSMTCADFATGEPQQENYENEEEEED